MKMGLLVFVYFRSLWIPQRWREFLEQVLSQPQMIIESQRNHNEDGHFLLLLCLLFEEISQSRDTSFSWRTSRMESFRMTL